LVGFCLQISIFCASEASMPEAIAEDRNPSIPVNMCHWEDRWHKFVRRPQSKDNRARRRPGPRLGAGGSPSRLVVSGSGGAVGCR